MDFTFTVEQDELRQAIVKLLAGRAAEARAAMVSDRGVARDLWRIGCAQLGLSGLLVAEAAGGAGATWVEAGVVLEEAGRYLAPLPLLSALAAGDLVGAGDDAAAIAAGEAIPALALAEAGRWSSTLLSTTAALDGDRWLVSGRKEHVLDGPAASVFVVSAATADGPALFLVDRAASGVTVQAEPTLDQTRRQASVTFGDSPGRRLDTAPERALDLLRVGLALESVGAARAALTLTLDHLRTRVQFGRPIGSFQALKHRAADLAVGLEAATSTAYYAGWAASAAPEELPVVAPLAKAECVATSVRITGESIQLLGGIGFTWEHDAHLYLKRAISSELLLGNAQSNRRLVAERSGLLNPPPPAAR